MTSVPEPAGPVTFVLDGGGGAAPPPPITPDALSATVKAATVRTVAVLLIVLLLWLQPPRVSWPSGGVGTAGALAQHEQARGSLQADLHRPGGAGADLDIEAPHRPGPDPRVEGEKVLARRGGGAEQVRRE